MFDAPLKVASLMRGFDPEWFVAGGWAIDLFLEKETRPHQDIEIAVFRRDQFDLQDHLAGWVLKKAVSGSLADWQKGEFLRLPIHEIHCFGESSDEPRRLEVLLNETDGENWIFRRNPKITIPLSESYLTGSSFSPAAGIKFLSPAVVLLYKSKSPRDKDEQDFRSAVGRLDRRERAWLKNALSICYSRHHWLKAF